MSERWGCRGPDPRDGEQARQDARELDLLVQETALSGISRRLLLVGLSGLPPDLRQPQHLRLAREAVTPLSLADRARVFQLPNDDIAIVWRGAADGAVRDSLQAIGHLFADDDDDPQDDDGLGRLFDLPEDAAELRFIIAAMDAAPPPRDDPRRGKALNGATLASLEAALACADLSRFARRRAVCARSDDGFELRWEQRTLNIAELADTLAPDHDLQAEPWLYLRLTRMLDRRLLNLLAAPEELRGARAFSLALNVGSILSPDFLRFDAALPATLRGQVILDLLPADLMADAAAFRFARDFARARRYRLMLRGIGADLLDVFPRALAGVDLIQIEWSPDLAEREVEQPAHMVLSGADTPAALEWGFAQGIELFQGRLAREDAPRADPPRMAGGNRLRQPLATGRRSPNRAG
jgi:hypothetical protein